MLQTTCASVSSSHCARNLLFETGISPPPVRFSRLCGLQLPPPQSTNLYREKYKGIALCLGMLSTALAGTYVNFGVFTLYNDKVCVLVCVCVRVVCFTVSFLRAITCHLSFSCPSVVNFSSRVLCVLSSFLPPFPHDCTVPFPFLLLIFPEYSKSVDLGTRFTAGLLPCVSCVAIENLFPPAPPISHGM